MVALSLALAVPASAAEWIYYDDGGYGVWTADSGSGIYEIDIGCGSGADHELKFGIFVPDETVKNVAEDASIPILVVVDGTAYGPLDAGIQHADDGTAIIAAWEFDDGRVGDIVRAMLASSGTTRVEFLGKAAVFEAAGIEGVGGQVKTGCAI